MTRKITLGAVRIYHGLQDRILLGNLQAKRDWGYAPEYVEAMWRMLRLDEPDDFAVATGETHSILEFVEETCGVLGLDWRKCVVTDPACFRPLEVDLFIGDSSKAKMMLGWEPNTKFKDLVKLMEETHLKIAAQEVIKQ